MKTENENWETEKPDIGLPKELLAQYEPQKCFSHSAISETYLLQSREDGKEYVAKIYDRYFAEGSMDERAILEKLCHPAIPKLTGYIETEDVICVIRDYVEGVSLDEIHIPVSEHALRSIGTQLCDILTYLHTQTPPVIHRDIKPPNVIINDEDEIRLIDFEISREYKQGAEKDTKLIASVGYSAPEQYGYGQTDARTDIFSLGKLLCWLMTGSPNILATNDIENRRLARVIQKCAMFAPDERYQSAEAAKKALIRAASGGQAKKISVRVLAAVIFLAVGFFIGRLTMPVPDSGQTYPPSVHLPSEPLDTPPDDSHTEDTAALTENQPTPSPTPTSDPVTQEQEDDLAAEIYTFKEPLIGQAARLMLNKGDDEPVTYGELETITEIYIYGNDVRDSGPEPENQTFGNVDNLDDFRAMKNLQTLALHRQTFTDVSPLADCLTLERIEIIKCNVTDLAPLSGLPHLTALYLDNDFVTDYSFLHSLESLLVICIFKAPIQSIADLGPLTGLHDLQLPWSTVESLDGIENMPWLKNLNIAHTFVTDFSPLNGKSALPHLQTLSIDPDMVQYLHTLDRDDVEAWW